MQKSFKAFYGIAILFFGSVCLSQQPKLMLPIGHAEWHDIDDVRFSPNGKMVITVSTDNTAKIWDAVSGLLLADLKHESSIVAAEFFPDGKKVLTGSADGTARVWSIATGIVLTDFKNSVPIYSPQISRDGKKILSHHKIPSMWDAVTGKLLFELKTKSTSIQSAVLSPDGKKIMTTDWKDSTRIWDALTGKFLFALAERASLMWYSALFSDDGKKIMTSFGESKAKIWDAASGSLITEIKGHANLIWSYAKFSPDGKNIITKVYDSLDPGVDIVIMDAMSGNIVNKLKDHLKSINSLHYSPDGKKIVSGSDDSTAKVRDAASGLLLADLKHTAMVNLTEFSPDGKKVVTTTHYGNGAQVWDLASGLLQADLKSHTSNISRAEISPDGTKIVSACTNGSVKIWDTSGMLLADLKGHKKFITSAQFSPDSKKLVTASDDYTAKIWDAGSGALLADLKGHTYYVKSAQFSPDGNKIVTISHDLAGKVWDAATGKQLANLKGHTYYPWANPRFSPDGKKIVTAAEDNTARIWDAVSGSLLFTMQHTKYVISAQFSPDGKKILTACKDSTAKVWDAGSGLLMLNLKGHTANVNSADFFPDGKKIITTSADETARVWDALSGQMLVELKSDNGGIYSARFSPDGKKIITICADKTTRIWDAASGALLTGLKGHTENVTAAFFTKDGESAITSSSDNTLKKWSVKNGELLYTFFAVDSNDYLVIDKYNHYDGTDGARKLLYFTCGTEVIELDQVKDQLWVPGLAERIMKGEQINAPKLSDLDICSLVPLVEQVNENKLDQYHYRITPRRGRLGKTVLYVNGIEAKTYEPAELIKKKENYELLVPKSQLQNFLKSGEENRISLKSYTAKNAISSRGVIINGDKETKNKIPPHLYAVMIGVSDYKGDELDLRFAAKDATDISKAIKSSAAKLLGDDKVHCYDLTTEKERYSLPEKKAIQQVLMEIGSKATANDILLIFFAGHGVMDAGKKQFYFLTADASKATAADAVDKVGISTAELTDWIQPSKIKAQKRILILDACNSGQAIKDFVKMGGNNQNYLAARNDEKAAQIKAIDKLNEKSGLFILSASASDQNAYELGRFSQGLLTYSLLKAIKQQPDILEENKYLNVSRWFNAAEKTVSELAKETGARQDPQIISNSNFNLGVVDDEVRAAIIMPGEKPLFASSKLFNSDPGILSDDLGLGNLIDNNLNDYSTGRGDAVISFMYNTSSADAYSANGSYEVSGNIVKCRINLRQNKETKYSFEISGLKTELKALAGNITGQITDWMKSKPGH